MSPKLKSKVSSVRKSREQLVDDCKRVIEDFQELAEETKNASGNAVTEGYNSFRGKVGSTLEEIGEYGGKINKGVCRCMHSTETSIGEHPWRSIAIAAACGFLLDRVLRR